MKTYLTILAAVLALHGAAAHADSWTGKTPALPTQAEYQAATQAIVQRTIEAEGWCSRTAPAPKSGQIVVYYVRDKNGACVPAFTQGRQN
jgi:hypothetical protein